MITESHRGALREAKIVAAPTKGAVSVSLGDTRPKRFPSVLDRPLRHLSALELTVYERSQIRSSQNVLQVLLFRDSTDLLTATAALKSPSTIADAGGSRRRMCVTAAPAISSADLRVRIDSPFQRGPPARVGGAIVTFEPGARTGSHTHPLGQTLIVTAGCGRVQPEGGLMRITV